MFVLTVHSREMLVLYNLCSHRLWERAPKPLQSDQGTVLNAQSKYPKAQGTPDTKEHSKNKPNMNIRSTKRKTKKTRRNPRSRSQLADIFLFFYYTNEIDQKELSWTNLLRGRRWTMGLNGVTSQSPARRPAATCSNAQRDRGLRIIPLSTVARSDSLFCCRVWYLWTAEPGTSLV